MTTEETARVVAVLMAQWPNHPVPNPDATVASYRLALDDVPFEAAMTAAAAWMKRSRFFPAACELRELAIAARWDLPTAEDAWREVRAGLAAGGIYGEPVWSCLPLHRAIRAIGWRTLCLSPEGDPAVLDRFARTYRTYRERAIREADVAALWSGAEVPRLERGEPIDATATDAERAEDASRRQTPAVPSVPEPWRPEMREESRREMHRAWLAERERDARPGDAMEGSR